MRAPRQDPPTRFANSPLWLIFLLLAALSRLNFQNCAKQKNNKTQREKRKIRPRTTNQKSSFRSGVPVTGKTTLMLYVNQSAMCLFSSPLAAYMRLQLWSKSFDALFSFRGTVALILADAIPSRTCPSPPQLGASHTDSSCTYHGAFCSEYSEKPSHIVFR